MTLRAAWSRGRLYARHAWGMTFARLWVLLVSTRWISGATFLGKPPKIDVPGRLVIGTHFVTNGNLFAPELTTGQHGELLIGDHVFVNQGTRIHASKRVTLGSRIEIGDLVSILDTNFHAVEPSGAIEINPIEIGDDSWICGGATLLPGVTLGRGCVVAAGAVVTRGVYERGSVLAGSPARVVRVLEIPDDFVRRGPGSAAYRQLH